MSATPASPPAPTPASPPASPTTLDGWLAYIGAQHPADIALGLDRVRDVAQRLGLAAPARQVVTVGGTNGKGSTVAFIDAIGRAAGWRVGAYTSPHLWRYNERVRIDGQDASDADLVAAFAAVEAARTAGTPVALTYFEFGTLAALQLFQAAGLDLAVLEVGLGGRLDAVNIVEPDVAVITTVDLDHQDWLGADREAIGFEKAGIARAWKPLVLGETDPPSSVLRHAYAIGASAARGGSDFFHEPVDNDHWRWREVGFEIELPNPALAAPVQRANAATAIAALRALPEPPPASAYAPGIVAARVRGRWEAHGADGVEIVFDVGHNPQAAQSLADTLELLPVAGRTHAVYAALADKDAVGVVGAFEGKIDRWWLGGIADEPRGQSGDALRARLQGTPAGQGDVFADIEAALEAARRAAGAGDRILVFGSFRAVARASAQVRAAAEPTRL